MQTAYHTHPFRHTAECLVISADERGLTISTYTHGKRATYDVNAHSISGELAPFRATVSEEAEATSCGCAPPVELPDGWTGDETVRWPCRSGGMPARWVWQDITAELDLEPARAMAQTA